jgi:uncharacterized lipoprotein YajG
MVLVKRLVPLAAVLALYGCSKPAPEVRQTQPFAASAAPAPQDPRKVLVVFGDSLAAGTGWTRA